MPPIPDGNMKIAYLSTSSLPSQAANSIHVMKMCAAFAGNGHEVLLIGKPGKIAGDPFEFYGIDKSFAIELVKAPEIPIIGGILQGIAMSRRLTSLSIAPDLLYGRHIYSLAFTARRGVPFILELHTIHRRRLVRQLTLRLAKRSNCRGIVVISDALRRDLISMAPWLDDKIVVAHDAADDPAANGIEIPERRSGANPTVGYVGHLYEGKGMEIIAEVAKRRPGIEFEVVGGTARDLAKWRARSPAKNIKFRGFVPHGRLAGRYRDFDICLLPTQSRVLGHDAKGDTGDIGRWTSPLKLFEYMSYELPIIASDVPVLREVLTNGKNALLVDPRDIDGWVAAIDALASNCELRASLGRQAREDFLNDYTWRSRALRVLEACASE
jgi:glycosyltransferase involved in cell wall biosynthesis